ncbi:DNA replication regulator sld2 [Pseudocyphellaria aurata]|nr:DNA replication regulator sld2 [Pseudocyphellaria aurata]
MSVLDQGANSLSTDQIQALRLELKEWEKRFSANNAGRKADREDIKRHPEIAQKYKLYTKCRAGPSSSPSSLPTKKRPPRPSTQTPQKRRKQSQPLHPSSLDPYDPPLSTHNTPIAHRMFIGPTPQKDGIALGIFDVLSPAVPTPPKVARSALEPIHPNSLKTPSKRRLDSVQYASNNDQENTPATKRLKPCPPSASGHAPLLTPSVRRTLTSLHCTPPSSRARVSKLSFDDTPAYLKRNGQYIQSLQNYTEGTELDYDESGPVSWSPMLKVGIRPKPFGKGLSALVRGLRELQEERLDEEMELLRELEGGSKPAAKITAVSASAALEKQPTNANDVLVPDSQAPDMPLGPDGDHHDSESDGDELEGKDRDGRPLKVWKKRGQKRSTRMVVMKPSRAKWKPEPTWKAGKNDDDEEEEVVPETQRDPTIPVGVGEQGCLNPDETKDKEDLTNVEAEHPSSEDEPKKKKVGKKGKPKKSNQGGKKTEVAASTAAAVAKEKGPRKKKVAATANANFRALKLRNKNSKAKGGGRFGRRR